MQMQNPRFARGDRVPLVQAPPQVPAGDAGVRPPRFADLRDTLRRRYATHPVRLLDRVADTKVEIRQYVETAELEHQEHLRCPDADPFHLHEILDDLGIAERIEVIE